MNMEASNCEENDSLSGVNTEVTQPARLHSSAVPIRSPFNGKHKHSNESVSSISSYRFSVSSASSGDTDIQYIKASELFPKKSPWVEGDPTTTTSSTPPFPFLPGEGILYEGRTVEGALYISNYRLYLHRTPLSADIAGISHLSSNNSSVRDINVPLGLVESVECKDIFYLNLLCKDGRSFRLVFANGECCQDWVKRLAQILNIPRKAEDVFSLAFCAWTRDCDEQAVKPSIITIFPWWRSISNSDDLPLTGENLFRFELERQEYDTSVTWRVSTANIEFKLSPSYPSHLLVPTSISDDMLETVAAFRSARRLPAVVWRNRRNGAVLGRCSQPEVGWLGWRSQEDENLLLSILNSCYYDSARNAGRLRQSSPNSDEQNVNSGEWNGDASPNSCNSANIECGSLKDLSEDSSCFSQGKKMLIVDARSYTTAVANRARGGGCEFPQYYPQCDIEFMNLANIHAVRKSFLLLRTLCSSTGNSGNSDQSNWFTQLDSTQWLHHMAKLLRASWYTAVNLEEQGRPVLVHCSDGWDRTPQIVSLAQLMIDPFYRTLKGFQILVQREWLEFGHKFADRCGLFGGCEDLNERCPIFLQFLDCVHQLMNQFPTAFEFNQAYLVKMVQHVYSNLFGTFLLNSTQERISLGIADRSHSLWNFLLEKRNEYCNYLYELGEEPLWPSYQVRDLRFWSAVFTAEFGSSGTGTCQTDECHNNVIQAPNPNTSSNSPCSSGYATPQQTALTDSMVDKLAWKNLNLKDDARNSMQDSTDTLVDDGIKLVCSEENGQIDGDLEANESFPLLEPEPSRTLLYRRESPSAHSFSLTGSQEKKNSPTSGALTEPQKPTIDDDEGSLTMNGQNFYQGDCPTCQKNWDLLNRNQETRISSLINGSCKAITTNVANVTRPSDSSPACLSFDMDGLLPSVDRQQLRLGQILAAKELELEALRRDLHQTRVALCRQVCHTCQSIKGKDSSTKSAMKTNDFGYGSSVDTNACQSALVNDTTNGQSISHSSWETVDKSEIDEKVFKDVLWVPDYSDAAKQCMSCSIPFWTVRRRHHCRNCGKVFCADCTARNLALPNLNLHTAVRVCNNCYDFLTARNEELNSSMHKYQQEIIPTNAQFSGRLSCSLSNLTSSDGHCSCHCCQMKRPSKFKTVTAGSN